MKIGIIGTGMIGGTLARLWSKAGHDVFVSSRHPETLDSLVKELNIQAGTLLEAAEFGEAILLSIPLSAVVEIDSAVAAAMGPKVVIDTSNAYPDRDGHVFDVRDAHPTGSSGWVAKKLGLTQCTKAFNTQYYASLLSDSGTGLAIPIASDSEGAIQVTSHLVIDAGYDPFLVGGLAEGRYFEPGTPAYGKGFSSNELAKKIQLAVTES